MAGEIHEKVSLDNNTRIAALEKRMNELTTTCEETKTNSAETRKKTDDLHRKFIEVSPSGEPPLADRIVKAVKAYENASWVGKTGLWIIMTLGGLAAASTQIMNWLKGMGKG